MLGLRLRGHLISKLSATLHEDTQDLFWILRDPADAFALTSIDGVRLGDEKYEEASAAWGVRYEAATIDERPGYFLMQKGFLREFGSYLRNDWNCFRGIADRASFNELQQLNAAFAEKYCQILLSCIDGAYWDIFSSQIEILRHLRSSLKDGEEIVLTDDVLMGK